MASSSAPMAAPRSAARLRADRLVGIVGRVREAGLLVALFALIVGVGLRQHRFVEPDNVRKILVAVSILAVMAVGETLVVLTRNVDLSVASMVGLVAYGTGDIFKDYPHAGLALVILAGLAMGLALGAVNGLLVTVGRVPAIVATLGTLYVYRGIDYWIAGGKQITISDVPHSYREIALKRIGGVPMPIIITAAIALVLAYLLRYTRSGRQLYAIGSNPPAARLAGIRSDLLVFGAFTLCGVFAGGVGGILWGARFGSVDARAAYGYELQVVAAVVVGGVNIFGGSGTALGAVLGAIMLGTIANALTILLLSEFWLQAISGAAILVAVTIDAFVTRQVQRALLARRNR